MLLLNLIIWWHHAHIHIHIPDELPDYVTIDPVNATLVIVIFIITVIWRSRDNDQDN